MDIEHALVSHIVRTGEVVPALEIKVSPDWFLDPLHREVWSFIAEFYRDYGKTPTPAALGKDFPDYSLYDGTEPLAYYIDKMSKYRRTAILSDGIATALEFVDEDPVEASAQLIRALTKMNTEVTKLRDVNLIDTYEQRFSVYEEVQNRSGQLLGLPMGIPSIDMTTAGFRSEQLITITGLPKAGKSALLMHAALAAHKHGATVLFIGFEMSNEEQAARHDAMLAKIDHLHLIRGGLKVADKERLHKTLRRRKNMQPFVLSADPSSSTTVSSIGAKIEQFQPDIVFVDGVYMMQDEEGGDDERKQLTNITRSFKRLAQRTRLPIVVTTQSLESKTSRSRGLTTNSIGYTSSFLQDSDIVMGVETPDEDEPDIKRAKIIASRTTALVSCLLHWDWSTGTVTELDGEDDDNLIDPGSF